MHKPTPEELRTILDLHRKWRWGEEGGVRAVLTGADLTGADLTDLQLAKTEMGLARADVRAVLDAAPNEVPGLLAALVEGRINGSVYSGECACLVGTIANLRGVNAMSLSGGLAPDSSRPAERWFMNLHEGDTPARSGVAAMTAWWIHEWQSERRAADTVGPVAS